MTVMRTGLIVLVALGFALLQPTGLRADELPAYPDKSKLLIWRDADGKEHPIKTAADWAKRRAHILAHMQEVMGTMPDAGRKVPLDVQTVEETKMDKFIRRKITIAVEKGD